MKKFREYKDVISIEYTSDEMGEIVESMESGNEEPLQLVELSALGEALKHLKTIYVDKHNWSTRPCETCDSASKFLGKKVGCAEYRELPAIKSRGY